MKQDSLSYNVFTGDMPEGLQLQTIKEIFSMQLRKLPIRETREDYPVIEEVRPSKPKSAKTLFHKTGKKCFINLQNRLYRKLRSYQLMIALLL